MATPPSSGVPSPRSHRLSAAKPATARSSCVVVVSAPFSLDDGRREVPSDDAGEPEHAAHSSSAAAAVGTYGGSTRYHRTGTAQARAEEQRQGDVPLPEGAAAIFDSNTRLHADQQGWRDEADQQRSRVATEEPRVTELH